MHAVFYNTKKMEMEVVLIALKSKINIMGVFYKQKIRIPAAVKQKTSQNVDCSI